MVTWLPHIFDAAEDPIANIRHSIINCVGTVERNPTLLVCKVYEPKLFLAIDDLAMGFVNIGFVNIGFVNIGFVCIGFEKHDLLLSHYGWPLKNNACPLPGLTESTIAGSKASAGEVNRWPCGCLSNCSPSYGWPSRCGKCPGKPIALRVGIRKQMRGWVFHHGHISMTG